MKMPSIVSRALPYITIAMILFVFVFAIIDDINSSDYLFSYDPWRHLFQTKYGESIRLISTTTTTYNSEIQERYHSILRTNTYLMHVYSGIDLFQIYRYFGLLLRIAYILLVIAIIFQMTRSHFSAAVGALLLLTSHYFMYRSSMTWPENQSLIFHLLSFWGFEKVRQERSSAGFALIGIGLLGSWFSHTPTLYALAFIWIGYGVYFLIQKDWGALKIIFVVLLIVSLIGLPILFNTLELIVDLVKSNLGTSSDWGSRVVGDARYQPTNWDNLITATSIPLAIFALMQFFTIIRNRDWSRIPLLIYAGFAAILFLAPYYNLFIPTDRLNAYILLPVVILSGLQIETLRQNWISPTAWTLFIGAICLLGLSSVYSTGGWFGMKNGEMPLTEMLNSRLGEHPDEIVAVDRSAVLMTGLLEYPEQLCPDVHINDVIPGGYCDAADWFVRTNRVTPVGFKLVAQYGNYYLYESND